MPASIAATIGTGTATGAETAPTSTVRLSGAALATPEHAMARCVAARRTHAWCRRAPGSQNAMWLPDGGLGRRNPYASARSRALSRGWAQRAGRVTDR